MSPWEGIECALEGLLFAQCITRASLLYTLSHQPAYPLVVYALADPGFHYVYILRDVATGQRHYTGVTQDLQERLIYHNSGHVPHTSKYAPWYIETAIAFRDKQKAYAYERYLKTGAGRAYATRLF